MAVPLAIPLVASALQGGFKLFQGIGSKKRASKIREEAQAKFDANPYMTPTEVMRSLSLAEDSAARTELPGQALYEAKIQEATGGAIGAIREAAVTPGDIVSGATKAYSDLYEKPLRDIAIRTAEASENNRRNLQSKLELVGQYRDKEWQQNVLLPYQNAMTTAGKLESAGTQNIFSGGSDILGGVTNFAMEGGFGGKTKTDVPIANTPLNNNNFDIEQYTNDLLSNISLSNRVKDQSLPSLFGNQGRTNINMNLSDYMKN